MNGTLLVDDILAMARRLEDAPPRAGCVLVDVNLPGDLCVCLPPNRTVVDALYGRTTDGDEVWRAMQGLRDKDFALVVPAWAEHELLKAARPADPPAAAFTGLMGLPVYRVRSRVDAPWRRMAGKEADAFNTALSIHAWYLGIPDTADLLDNYLPPR